MIVQWGDYQHEINREAENKDQALEELRAAAQTYLPMPGIKEKWRRVYRYADRESYFVLIKGATTLWRCTLRLAELVSDSTDPAVASKAQAEDAAAEMAAGPQDRVPPGFG
ncbi:hypothetical protein [Streptomyces yerevanensis]|uniref:hypothetical protein n=1 Tax=Streptomyces yerevanensis TaxID=66378 RepID=UPI000526021B|nr:hypothetical protein [Streptomyces yerevanensis]